VTHNRTIAGYALLRLLWRPMSAFLLFAAVWVTVFPWIFLPDEPESWMGPQSPLRILEFHNALWQDAILLPIVTGGLLSGMTHEALQSGVSWMLPRYRSRILQATVLTTIVFALLVSVAIALLISWHAGLAALGIATLSFAIGWRVFDPAASNFFRAGAAVVVFAVIRRPSYLLAAIEANPGTIALLATSAGVALLWTGLTSARARELALRPRTVGGLRESLKGRDGLPWEGFGAQVAPPALPGLIRAGLFESARIRRLGRFPEIVLQIVFLGVMGWVFRASSMVASLPMIFVGLAGSQLKEVFPYPISRKHRADAFFLASFVDAAAVAVLSASAVLLLDKIGWWRENRSPTPITPQDALIGLLFLFLFVPIVQLPLITGPLTATRKRKISTRHWVVAVCALAIWLVASRIARIQLSPLINQNPSLVDAVILFSFVVIQIAFWGSLRFSFARRDLG
jgi:hypothetical protein